jgi:hypothetical protein
MSIPADSIQMAFYASQKKGRQKLQKKGSAFLKGIFLIETVPFSKKRS